MHQNGQFEHPTQLQKNLISRSGGASRLKVLNRNFKQLRLSVLSKKSKLFDLECRLVALNQQVLAATLTKPEPQGQRTNQAKLGLNEENQAEDEQEAPMASRPDKKAVFGKHARRCLVEWYVENSADPYPEYTPC
jgi:hypothetical protein